jgi:phosphoribosylglycinamide formyltransferase-1
MQALLQAALPCTIAAVISNRADAVGLGIAADYGIPTEVVAHQDYANRTEFDAALSTVIDTYQPDFVVLAGFMRILTAGFVTRYMGKMVNIHPSLLPAYDGLNTHARALQDAVKIHGCSVHFVTPELDHGPIIIQAAVPVLCDDNEETLCARVLQEEHRIYPQAVRWLCEGEVSLSHGSVKFCHQKQSSFALISPGLE